MRLTSTWRVDWGRRDRSTDTQAQSEEGTSYDVSCWWTGNTINYTVNSNDPPDK